MADWIDEREDCLLLSVVAVPKAARTRVMGMQDGRLKVQMDASGIDANGNTVLVKFIAGQLGIATAQVDVSVGLTSKHKTLRVVGVNAQRVRLLLEPTSALLD